MAGIRDTADDSATVRENWTFRLESGAHALRFGRSGSIVGSSLGDVTSVVAVRRQFSFTPSAVFAFYGSSGGYNGSSSNSNGDEDDAAGDGVDNNGGPSVVQMKAGPPGSDFFPSAAPLERLYTLGGSGEETGQVGNASLDFLFSHTRGTLGALGGDVAFEQPGDDHASYSSPPPSLTVLLSSNSGDPYWSGLQEVLFGGALEDAAWMDHWGAGWEGVPATVLPAANSSEIAANYSWSDDAVAIGVNDLDFPVLAATSSATVTGEQGDNLPSDDLHALLMGVYASPVGCLCTHANAVAEGVAVGQMATTIARPDRGYSGTYNYFDPDDYIATSALLWSGDPFLQEQVRLVLQRSGSFLTSEGQLPHHFEGVQPTYQALSGEIQTGPNVFWILSCLNYAKASANWSWLRGYMPTLRLASRFLFDLLDYDLPPLSSSSSSSSSSTAGAPASLVRAHTSAAAGGGGDGGGDGDGGGGGGGWDEGSTGSLASVPGSLMIDVFARSNYTSDTNAMLVGFFREFALAEEFVGNASGAQRLSDLADDIAKAMNLYLWCPAGGASDDDEEGGAVCDSRAASAKLPPAAAPPPPPPDAAAAAAAVAVTTKTEMTTTAASGDHFVTQWNQDGGSAGGSDSWTYRDMVDYDANLMAVAHGVPTDDPSGEGPDGGARAKRILARVDEHPGVCRTSSTWTSEVYYGDDDVVGGNCGDSWTGMGRIAWFDSLARRAVGDAETFNALLLEPLKAQLRSTTWMHERLNCDGSQMLNRTAMYFEYPATTAMLLHRVRYGVELGYGNRVDVAPFGLSSSSSSSSSSPPFHSSSSDTDRGGRGGRLYREGRGGGNATAFSYHVNGVHVEFSEARVSLDVDRSVGQRALDDDDDDGSCPVSLSLVLPSTTFHVSAPGLPIPLTATSDEAGFLSFSVPLNAGRVVAIATAVAGS